MTTTNDRIRAVLLTALMVLSVFGGSIAFAGSAAATDVGANVSVTNDTVILNSSQTTDTQTVTIDVNNAGTAGNITLDLSETFASDVNATVTGVGDDGAGNASLVDYSDGDEEAVINVSDPAATQATVDLEFSAESGATSTRAVTHTASDGSNSASVDFRLIAGTSFTVSADGDDQSAFAGQDGLFMANTSGDVVRIYSDSDHENQVARLDTSPGSSANYDTSDLDPGQYYVTFDRGGEVLVELLDLGLEVEAPGNATTTSGISVDVSASSDAYNDDITARLVDGDGEYVEDSDGNVINGTSTLDGSGEGTVSVNSPSTGTYTVEIEHDATGVTTETEEVDVSEGDVAAEFGGDGLFQTDQGDVATVTFNFEDTTSAEVQIGESDVGFMVNGTVTDDDGDGEATLLVNSYSNTVSAGDEDTTWSEDTSDVPSGDPVDAGEYELQVGSSGVGDDAQDLGTLILNERSTDGASTWIAPRNSDFSELADVSGALDGGTLTESNEIADDDVAVVAFEASGIFGMLADNELGDLEDELQLTIGQTEDSTPPNTPAKVVENSSVDLVTDSTNNTLYVVLDTTSLSFDTGSDIAVGDEYDVTLTVAHEELSTAASGETDSVSSSLTVVDRESAIDVNGEDLVEVESGADQEITGTSSLAPGSTIDVRVRADSSSNPFVLNQRITVDEDGTWAGSFDFSEAEVEQEFTAGLRNAGSADDASGVVVEDLGTPTPTPTPDDGTETPTPTPTPTPDDGTETPTQTDEPDETTEPDDGQPGFGVVVALLAMLGAALLAARRFE